MTTNIGYSSVFPTSGFSFFGPYGPTGPTGPTGTTGPTGATGLDSNYITEIITNSNGQLEFVFSDSTRTVLPQIKGPTGVYAGLTAFSLGNGIPIFKGICGGITLDFYNFRVDGALGLTYAEDGTLIFTISPNNVGAGVSASIQNNRIVYLKNKNYVMTTDLITELSNNSNKIGTQNYGYLNFGFGGETSGRNVVADIRDSILTVGPMPRGEKIITLDTFYDVSEDGITLDVSRATVYHVQTPIGIKAFKSDQIPAGSVMSFTMIIEGDNVWNFPSDVYFDQDSKPIFYPGTNILHIQRTSLDTKWRANFTARGFGVSEIENPGIFGSCCYFDVDQTKHCEDYVTQSYCLERNGTFAPSIPCRKNPCIVEEQQGQYDGICCSEGRCLSDIDPSFCQTIGGYFISGITCGQPGTGKYPDDNATNIGEDAGICYNKCKSPSICCKNGECLGQLTEPHCELLGGNIVAASNCIQANCCDLIEAPGACCKEIDGEYQCNNVQTPYECKNSGGIYMGKNTNCESGINCSCIPEQPPTVCYNCQLNSLQNECGCVPVEVTDGSSCESNGYSSTPEDCDCNFYMCHQCDGTICTNVPSCRPCAQDNLRDGFCSTTSCQFKRCFKSCVNCECQASEETNRADLPCSQNTEYPNENCDCDESCERSVGCFWCFPNVDDPVPTQPEAPPQADCTNCNFDPSCPTNSSIIIHTLNTPIFSSTNELYLSWSCSPINMRCKPKISDTPQVTSGSSYPIWQFKFASIDGGNGLDIISANHSSSSGSYSQLGIVSDVPNGSIIPLSISTTIGGDSRITKNGNIKWNATWSPNTEYYIGFKVFWINPSTGNISLNGNFGWMHIQFADTPGSIIIKRIGLNTISGSGLVPNSGCIAVNSSNSGTNEDYSFLSEAHQYFIERMQSPYRAMVLMNRSIASKLDLLNSQSAGLTFSLIRNTGTPVVATTLTKTVTIPGESSYELPYFIENYDRNIPNGVSSVQIANMLGNSVVSTVGKFNCYYVGSYNYDSVNKQNNRNNCLDRFGYQNVPNKQNCKLCDFNPPFQYTISPQLENDQVVDTVTVNSVEPYSVMGNSNIKANGPFPPLWGRITYGWEQSHCSRELYVRHTSNLRLMSENEIIQMCHTTRTGNLMSYMNTLHEKYKSSTANRHSVLNDMVSGMVTAMGSPSLIGDVINKPPPEDGCPGNLQRCERCLKLPYVKYDPYLMCPKNKSLIYGAHYRYPHTNFNYGNCDWNTRIGPNCGCGNPADDLGNDATINDLPLNVNGWYLPYYQSRILDQIDDPDIIPPDYWNTSNSEQVLRGAYYYPPKHQLVNLTGEIYFNKPSDEEDNNTQTLELVPQRVDCGYTIAYNGILSEYISARYNYGGVPRGIFGRNLRYNLDQFRTASVFWHTDATSGLTQTMKYTIPGENNVSIPINVMVGWFNPGSDCYGGGNGCLTPGTCTNGNCSDFNPSVCLGSQGGESDYENCINSGSGSGGPSNWSTDIGLIAPSLRPAQTQQSVLASKTKTPINESSKSKTVKIAEGICVNMMCPECNNYEIC